MPLGLLGETNKVIIDSSKALVSGGALADAIEQTFEGFMESCLKEIEEEKVSK